MFDFLLEPQFWVGLGQIILINIVLSGDNAVVIALAARSLPRRQQTLAVFWGAGAAVAMRIVLTIVGAVLLFWIAVKLLLPENGADDEVESSDNLWAAIKTILIADLVMSLDNVIGVAAAAKGDLLLLILGLVISIPLVVFGATVLMKLMERWPIIITIGAGLLGWVAGEMIVTDPLIKEWVDASAAYLHWVSPATGVAFVVLLGKWLAARGEAARREVVDLATEQSEAKSTQN
jgi:YjbE family integral membrane protein